MYAEMLRRMQSKDVEEKKKLEKAAIIAAADSELKMKSSESIDLEEEARLQKRQAGTQVTLESFMQWKVAFEAEMEALALANGTLELTNHSKLSGKQLFLSNNAALDLEEALLAASESMDFSNDKNYQSSSGGGGNNKNNNSNRDRNNNDEDDDDDDDDSDYVPGEEDDDDNDGDYESEDDS